MRAVAVDPLHDNRRWCGLPIAMAFRPRHRILRLLGHVKPAHPAAAANFQRRFSTTDSESSVLSDVAHGVGFLTLNRPKALNSLTLEMVRSLHQILSVWKDDPEIKLIVMKGAGEKAFCAGGDVVTVRKSVLEHPGASLGAKGMYSADFFREEYQLNHAIFSAHKSQVSVWDGFVMGGGVGVSIGSRFRVATEKTVFAMPETAIGLFPDVGGTWWLPRLPGGLGLYIGLTGQRMKAADLLYSGIATHYIPSDRLRDVEKALQDLGDRLTAVATPKEIERVLRRFVEPVDTSKAPLAVHRVEIDQAFEGKPDVESVLSQLEAQGSEWSQATIKLLSKMSPTSLKVTLRALNEGARLPLDRAFVVEYRLSQACMRPGSDFLEGVRALLVDKDGKPQWKPASLSEVTKEHVDSFFAPLGEGFEFELQPAEK